MKISIQPNLMLKVISTYMNMTDNSEMAHNKDHHNALTSHNTILQYASTLTKDTITKKKKKTIYTQSIQSCCVS